MTARLGNVRNELGVFYMNLASSLMKSFGEPSREECDLWKKSYQYFEKGIEAFSVTIDKYVLTSNNLDLGFIINVL